VLDLAKRSDTAIYAISLENADDAVTIALGYSPDQKRLWVVGERSSVTALSVR